MSNLSNASEDYKNKTVPKYHDVLEKYYSEREGPYLLGDEVSYADFAVYMSIDNDTRTKTIPVSYSKVCQRVLANTTSSPSFQTPFLS